MVASLTQAMINTVLADNRFISALPDLAEARRRLATLTQKAGTAGCCGSTTTTSSADDIRAVLSWIKRMIANWNQANVTTFLTLIGQPILQVAYYNPSSRTTEVVVLKK